LAPAGYLLDPDVGSDYERPWRLVEGLVRSGLRVVVVARETKRLADLGPLVEFEPPPGRSPTSPAGRIIDRGNLYIHARRVARREVASGRALVVHHLGPCSDQSPSLIGKVPVPFVYGPQPARRPRGPQDDEWLSWLLTPRGTRIQAALSKIVAGPAGLAGHLLWRRTLRRADAITFEAKANVPAQDSRFVVIHPGVDTTTFQPRPEVGKVPGRVIAVGRLLSRKGHDVLLRAVSHVVRQSQPIDLLLVGSGPQEPALRLLAKQLAIESSVTFTGNVSRAELPTLLCSAEVFCHPARWDNVPFAPLEAMASALPCAVSAAGALPEIVGDAGLVHAIGDSEALALDLIRLLSSASSRHEMGAAARSRVLEEYTWRSMSDAYLGLYRRLADSRGRITAGDP
jgi:glycosyltransferase involved in cell wall biosynthesis